MSGKINFTKINMIALTVFLLLFLPLINGCKTASTDDSTNPAGTHNVNISGFKHKEGLFDPETNCTSCHGADLKGSGSAPSCFACHGKKW